VKRIPYFDQSATVRLLCRRQARSNGSSTPPSRKRTLDCSTWSPRICQRVTGIDRLLVEVPRGDARSSLFRLKDYPRAPSAGVIKGDIVRLHLTKACSPAVPDAMNSAHASCGSLVSLAAVII
jgi:hypothetical protein